MGMTRTRSGALLAELHAHTTWSDGILSVPALVHLYGAQGFDVLCITDHVSRTAPAVPAPRSVTAGSLDAYLAEIELEAARAREEYGLLVVPGLELSYNDPDPAQAAHALAIGLRSFVPVDEGIDEAIEMAVQAGAAVVAAHPFDDEPATHPAGSRDDSHATRSSPRGCTVSSSSTGRSSSPGWRKPVCRASRAATSTASSISAAGRASSCARDEEPLIAHLRSRRPVFITEVGAETTRIAA